MKVLRKLTRDEVLEVIRKLREEYAAAYQSWREQRRSLNKDRAIKEDGNG